MKELPMMFSFVCRNSPDDVVFYALALGNSMYTVSWIDPETGSKKSLRYRKEKVQGYMDAGTWILTGLPTQVKADI